MTEAEKQALISALGEVIVTEVQKSLEPVQQELARLTLKLEHAELQAREMRYAGTWNAGSTYKKGNFVTHGGSLWCCLISEAKTMPGSDYMAWQLAVKSTTKAA